MIIGVLGFMEQVRRMKTKDFAYIGLFAVIIAICSWLSVPATVPFTLQTFAVFCALGLLGGKRGTLAVLVYLLLGAVGLPVFSGFMGGFGRAAGDKRADI
jgi:biotin transport system substrate-specific component